MTSASSSDGQAWALGLMSGTSLDGIDAALIRSDGLSRVRPGPSISLPYDSDLRARLRSLLGGQGPVEEVERALTLKHAEAVDRLLRVAGLSAGDIRVVGFHGHTILHRPEEGRTWQIGDGALLAAETGIDVVCDMRSQDVARGGEGAPLVPLYQAALCAELPRPLAVVNIGGVANVTWIGLAEDAILAFDTGPGNALINDWVESHGGEPLDRDGVLARAGQVDEAVLKDLLDNPYFARRPAKSLDRDDFTTAKVKHLSLSDGAATLTAFTAASVAVAEAFFPEPVVRWLITGGGRHNPVLMTALSERLGAPVDPVEAVGWQGDAVEAQAFAYLALRSLAGLPLTLPGTTGVSEPVTGGRHYAAAAP